MKLATLIVMLGAVSASILFAAMAFLIYIEFPAQQDRLLKQGGWTLAENLRQQVEPMVLTDDRLRLSEAISAAKISNENIDYIFVLDDDKVPLASTFAKGVPKNLLNLVAQEPKEKTVTAFFTNNESRLNMSMPLMDGDLGSLHIGINRALVLAFASRSILKLSIVFFVMTVAALITAVLIGRGVGKPLNQIANALRKASGRWPQLDHVDTGPTLEVQEFVVILRQMINELEQAERKRQDYEHKLLATERLACVGELASEVAHEINNPLDGLIEITRYLEQVSDDPEKVRKYVPSIKQGLERIEKTGRRLLSFSRSDATNYREVFDVCRVILDTIALLDGSMKKRGITIKVSRKDRCFAIGNAVATGQAVMNLLLNAADATANNGGEVSIDVTSGNREVLVAVEDKGPGVSEEISEKIFEPFFSTKRASGGTGLGLAVSRNLIRKGGGELVLAERQTQTGGAKFVVKLLGYDQRGDHNGSQG
jgi:signal transduction histidine kinase